MHGGPSPGAPCGERNGNYKHGRRTKAAITEQREAKATREIIRQLAKML